MDGVPETCTKGDLCNIRKGVKNGPVEVGSPEEKGLVGVTLVEVTFDYRIKISRIMNGCITKHIKTLS